MKLNKIVCWSIIGILCYLALYCFFGLLGLLNKYSGLLQAVLIIIGFIFVRRQIQIEKNKDIFFSFQKEISQFMYDLHKKQRLSHIDFVNVINDCLAIKDYDIAKEENEEEAIEEENKYLFEKYGSAQLDEIINKVLNPYTFEIMNNNILSTPYYKWWLQNNCDDFQKLIDSDSYKKTFYYYNIYFDIIKNVNAHGILPIMKVGDKLTLSSSISNELEKEVKKYYESYNLTSSKFEVFLTKLAKEKGIS